MRTFITDIMAFSRSKGLKNGICLYAFRGHEEYDRLWAEVAALDTLDIFGCDPYWRWHGRKDPEAHVRDFSKYVVETARPSGKGSQVWIQAMRLPSGAEPEVEKAILAAADEGVTHIAAWSYDGGELLDTVLSERPQQVWQAVERAFTLVRKKM